MAWCAADSAAWWRRALAWARNEELSTVIAGVLIVECFEGGDDLVQAGLDAAQVLGMTELAFGVCLGDEALAGRGLPPVELEGHGRGVGVWAGVGGVGGGGVLAGGV